MLFSLIAEKCKKRTLVYKASLCSLCVTGVEFIFGVVFNIMLKINVWDYSGMPFNLFGQVCLLYTFLWGVLSAFCLPLADIMNRKLQS